MNYVSTVDNFSYLYLSLKIQYILIHLVHVKSLRNLPVNDVVLAVLDMVRVLLIVIILVLVDNYAGRQDLLQ